MRSVLLCAAIVHAGCGGSSPRRTGPPGGGVDPATIAPAELSMGAAPRGQAPDAPPPARPTGVDDIAPTPAGTSGATTGPSLEITAEHCKEMGRKFQQLTVDGGASRAQADKVGQEITAKCTKEQVGTRVTRTEYECILAAKAMLDVASCK